VNRKITSATQLTRILQYFRIARLTLLVPPPTLSSSPFTKCAEEPQKVPIKGLKDVPKRALVNYNDDVLASN